MPKSPDWKECEVTVKVRVSKLQRDVHSLSWGRGERSARKETGILEWGRGLVTIEVNSQTGTLRKAKESTVRSDAQTAGANQDYPRQRGKDGPVFTLGRGQLHHHPAP